VTGAPTILTVVGTRPEAIKLAPVLKSLEQRTHAGVTSLLCSTGQHRELLGQALDAFGLTPDFDLALMEPDQRLVELTARLLEGLDSVVEQVHPDWIVAQGDTTTVLASALVAFYAGVRFAHVEAGLRTGDIRSPYPEEMNRRVADGLASALFAPTETARAALRAEGHAPERIHVTGNTVVDAVLAIAAAPYDWAAGPLAAIPPSGPIVLVTAHRRESFGGPLRDICTALRELAGRVPHAHLVFPVHLNPQVRGPVDDALRDVPNVALLEPLDYASLVHVMKRAALILTDSGGIQEEAPSFGVPVLVMREKTERTEAIEAGVAKLVGTDPSIIVAEAVRLLSDPLARRALTTDGNPFGDGHAAGRIVEVLLRDPDAS
jgi:UDP-N-acetylglucosamine 2-epimerase